MQTQTDHRVPTPAIAIAAGQDAGNRSMRAAGRTEWNDDDWNAACDVSDRLFALIPAAA